MKNLRSLLVSAAAFAVVSCGGGSGTILDPDGGGGGNGGGGNGGGGTGTVSLGNGIPPAFTAGVIDVAVPSLSAGGSTSLSVSLVSDGALYTQSTDVTFTSVCIAQGLATVTSPVTTSTGIATTNYVATGCSGDDVITATATAGGNTLTATGTVTVASAAVGSIQFISATPTKIGLQGTGGLGLPETSTVVFRVVDSTGGPVPGEDVTFSLNTQVGGITLTPATATSGADGRVQTVIQAGTVATTVRVTATVDSTGTATQSSQLIITTGLPDADSFSIAISCSNIEAYDYDGVQSAVTVRLSDRFQNPVPDGTAVTFNAEGGSIGGGCTTTSTTGAGAQSGFCAVNWTSSNPRPANGRVTILATAIGEESFTDTNGNGYFNDGENFVDLDEPFRDEDEDGIFTPGEVFYDFDGDSTRDVGDGEFSGLLCNGPGAPVGSGECAVESTLGIGINTVIIMSGSTAVIDDNSGDGVFALPGESVALVTVGDLRNQPMPSGTTISAEVTNGKLVGDTSYTMPCTSQDGPSTYPFFLEPDATSSSGFLIITVTTPRGVSTKSFVSVTD